MGMRDAMLTDSPIGFWDLQDTSGATAVDSGTGAHDGTYTNGPTLNNSGGPLVDDSPSTNAVYVGFDGTDDYITVPDHADHKISGDLTIEAWIYPTSFGSYKLIVGKQTSFSNKNAYSLYLESGTGKLYLQQCNSSGTTQEVWTTTGLSLDTWQFVQVRRRGSDGFIELFVDGDLRGSGFITITPDATTTTALTIGADGGGTGNRYTGRMCYVAIYNARLTDDQLAAHMLEAYTPTVRVTSVATEVIILVDNSDVRITSVAPEAVILASDANVRMTGLAVEVVISLTVDNFGDMFSGQTGF
jgi:hypothetical protein